MKAKTYLSEGVTVWRICAAVLVAVLALVSEAYPEKGRPGLVLVYDDAHPSWRQIIAPELARVGGVATCFVSNRNVHGGRISFAELRVLQDRYGWEIGTHTYHHLNAPSFVKRKGLKAWVDGELNASVDELRSAGLKVRSMTFPFNAFTPELAALAVETMGSFRREELFPVAPGVAEDGSIPGTSIDLLHHVPMEVVFQWIDLAQEKGWLLFLYGHQVLPDEEFSVGTVASVSTRTLVARDKIRLSAEGKELYLVPDTDRRLSGPPIPVVRIEGNAVTIGRGDLSRLSRPGAKFMIGPPYAMRLSEFRTMIQYAAERLNFYTVYEAVNSRERWRR